jgi:oxygen-independent coproporphyrinogen-3 oxidase
VTYNVASETRSLYLHWPFCPYKCHFCPFVAIASHDQYMERYHHALLKEIEQFSGNYTGSRLIETIFLGGGTPSTYPPPLLLDTFGTLIRMFTIVPHAEITIEVNPGTVNEEKLQTWKKAGINRLSIGVQSLNDGVLKNLNRHQTASSVLQLLEIASPLFENISVDLILGLPDVSPDEWKQLIQTIVTWPIKHVSVYF